MAQCHTYFMLVANNHKTRLACLDNNACRILHRDKKTYLVVAVSYACKLFVTFALMLNVTKILLAIIKPKLFEYSQSGQITYLGKRPYFFITLAPRCFEHYTCKLQQQVAHISLHMPPKKFCKNLP